MELFWIARGRTEHRREAVLPNGAVELIFNLSDPQWVVREGRRSQRFTQAFLAGTWVEPLWIEDERETDLLGVRFRPGGAADWVPGPLRELTHQVADASAAGLRWSEPLRQALGEAKGDRARIECVVATLRRERRRVAMDVRVGAVLRALGDDTEPLPISALAKKVGVTHKHLDALFHRSVGISPRQLRRVLRFHRVVSAIEHGPPRPWAALAADGGFADQPHLIREFRAFAGCTPAEFLRRRTDDGWHLKESRGR